MAQVTATSRHRPAAVDTDTAVDLVSRLAWGGVVSLVRDRQETGTD